MFRRSLTWWQEQYLGTGHIAWRHRNVTLATQVASCYAPFLFREFCYGRRSTHFLRFHVGGTSLNLIVNVSDSIPESPRIFTTHPLATWLGITPPRS